MIGTNLEPGNTGLGLLIGRGRHVEMVPEKQMGFMVTKDR